MGDEPSTKKRVIVSNTGPLLHLSEIGRLEWLTLLGRVYVPVQVHQELHEIAQMVTLCEGIETVVPTQQVSTQAQKWVEAGYLHQGEAMAIALAQEMQCDWFFTDDTEARLFAESLGLEVHGSLGIVIACASLGFVRTKEAEEAVLNLHRSSSLWLSERVVKLALDALQRLSQ